jgi:Na+/melibiose symporter-like transporter
MVFLAGGIVLIGLYPIDAKTHRRINDEIDARRTNG